MLSSSYKVSWNNFIKEWSVKIFSYFSYGALSLRMNHSIDNLPYKSSQSRMDDSWKAVEKSFMLVGNSIQKAIEDNERTR